MKMSPQINQILFSAHSSFGFYLTLTIQYSGYYHMFTTQTGKFFTLVSVKRDLKMCILNTSVELSAFCIITKVYLSYFK